ncbi:unnamed protein product [Aphanomyces euteiches]|uniref:BZIP domain-containing protein n=1 Tax=Aphanomyces euteiches TaxID=100861 RepID=A0A6G0XIG4_9STRA|nr:hypothetical protein Ae201684_004518 [Aphanomyces euteiches]KAH9093861.1 hypothetical protein Ae201684P_016483 [Aphanomyces euteiches]
MSKITKPKRNYLYSPYDMPIENGDDEDDAAMMMDPVLSALPSNLTRNLWDDWNEVNDENVNFAAQDMEKRQPVSLLDSIMGNNVKTEDSDMMSPPISSAERRFNQEISEMLLPPPAVSTATATTVNSYDKPQSHVFNHQYASSNGGNPPISPPRETMANVAAYSPPPPPQHTNNNQTPATQSSMFNAQTAPSYMNPPTAPAPPTASSFASMPPFHAPMHPGNPAFAQPPPTPYGMNHQVPPTASAFGFDPTAATSSFGAPSMHPMMAAPAQQAPPNFLMYNNNSMLNAYPNPMMNAFMPSPYGAPPMFPFVMPTNPPPPLLLAKPPLKPQVPLARKPGTGEISSMLQSLLDEEAEKRDKKLERNRDSARESRKKQQKYVEVLEDGIQHLQISKDALLRHHFGRSPVEPSQLDLMSGASPLSPSFAVVMQSARQRRLLGQPKADHLEKVFAALVRTISLLQSSLMEMHMLYNAKSNGLNDVLGLTPTQITQLDELAATVRQQQTVKVALLVKAFKALRRQAFELGAFAPSLDVYFRAVLSPEQVAKMVTWTETNRNELMRLEWRA